MKEDVKIETKPAPLGNKGKRDANEDDSRLYS